MKNRRARFYRFIYRSFYGMGVILLLTGALLSVFARPAEAGFRGIQITSTSRPKELGALPPPAELLSSQGRLRGLQTGTLPATVVPGKGTISVRFTAGDTALCELAPTTIQATAVVTLPELPEGVEVILQTAFRVVNPPDLRTENEYSRRSVINGDRVTLSGRWPGVRPGDNVVEIHFGAILLDPAGNPISDGAGLDFFWYPYVCAAPTVGDPGTGTPTRTATQPSATQTATHTSTATQPALTNTPTHTSTATQPALTNTPTNTATPTQPALTNTPTNTATPTQPALTNTPTNTTTATQPALTNTPTRTGTATLPVLTGTATRTATRTVTPSLTSTNTPTSPPPTVQIVPSGTPTNTVTATNTATGTVVASRTPTRTNTATRTRTATSAVSTASPTPPPTITNTATVLPTVSVFTSVPSSTPSPTNTAGVPITGATSTPPPTITVGVPVTGGAGTPTSLATSRIPQATTSGTPQVVPVTGAGVTRPTAIPVSSALFWQRLTTYLGLVMLGLAVFLHGMDRQR